MSWKDKIENGEFTITTGDGKVFKPLWKPGESSKEYNTSAYNFINQEGTLVDRKKPQSSKYPLVFWFQGDDHVEQTSAFLKSADDPRAWEIAHPFYGLINGQPLGIERSDADLSITRISVDFWESIAVDFPDDEISIKDRIQAKALSVQAAGIKSYSNFVPQTANIVTMKLAANNTQGLFSKIAGKSKVLYQNAASTATNFADKLLSAQALVISKQQQLFTLPVDFEAKITSKIGSFKTGLLLLENILKTKNDKFLYESQGATAIAALCQCAVNPLAEDYTTRNQIVSTVNSIIEISTRYASVLDNSQVSQYDKDNTWNPNSLLQSELNSLVIDTIGNLQKLAFEAKQERIIYTEKNTNLIILTHRYIGLDPEDKNIENFREINNIKNDELFLIPKGRKIKYFA